VLAGVSPNMQLASAALISTFPHHCQRGECLQACCEVYKVEPLLHRSYCSAVIAHVLCSPALDVSLCHQSNCKATAKRQGHSSHLRRATKDTMSSWTGVCTQMHCQPALADRCICPQQQLFKQACDRTTDRTAPIVFGADQQTETLQRWTRSVVANGAEIDLD
jgi:hypothetical protein